MKISTIAVTLAALAFLPTITACSPCVGDSCPVDTTTTDHSTASPLSTTVTSDGHSTETDATSGVSTMSSTSTNTSTSVGTETETDACDPTDTSGGSGGGCDATTGPDVCVDLDDIPEAGDAWGPCTPFGGCNGPELFCHINTDVSICHPICDGSECSAPFDCHGTCAGNECLPSCNAAASCPYLGMLCTVDFFAVPTCVWPLGGTVEIPCEVNADCPDGLICDDFTDVCLEV